MPDVILEFRDDVVLLEVAGAALLEPIIARATAAAERAEDAADANEAGIYGLGVGGDLPGGAPAGRGSWLAPPPGGTSVAAGADLLSRGIKYVANIPAGGQAIFRGDWDRPLINGEYVLCSVLVRKQAGQAFPSNEAPGPYITLGNVPQGGGGQQGFYSFEPEDLLRVEDLTANLRRYVVGGQLTALGNPAVFSFILVNNSSAAGIEAAGFALGRSSRFHSDIEWTDFDPFGEAALSARLDQAEDDVAALQAGAAASTRLTPVIPAGGNLPDGAPAARGGWLVPQTVIPVANADVRRFGVEYEAEIAAGSGAYFTVQVAPDHFERGDYIRGSVLIRKQPATSWDMFVGDWLSFSTIQADNTQPEPTAISSPGVIFGHEEIAANVRRYWIGRQYAALTQPIAWVLLFVNNIFADKFWGSAFSVGLSHVPIADLDWTVFDPAGQGATAVALDDFSDRLDAIDGGDLGDQPTPRLLSPANLFTRAGDPLALMVPGLTYFREATQYRFGISTAPGGVPSPFVWDDGSRLLVDPAIVPAGAGALQAVRRGKATELVVHRRPVTVRSSAGVINTAADLLVFGDSLSYRGWMTLLAGMLDTDAPNVNFIGTFVDIGGTPGEQKSSWATKSLTWGGRWVNQDGSGQLFPVRVGGGAGAALSTTIAGGSITAINIDAPGAGYSDVVGLPLQLGNNAYGTVDVVGGALTNPQIVNAGAGFGAPPVPQLPPTWAEYAALDTIPFDFGSRWRFNPWVRPAVAGDPAGQVFNHYRFDLAWGLARAGLPTPKIVMVALHVNDVLRAAPTAEMIQHLGVIRDQVRAAIGVNGELAFCIYGLPSWGSWTRCVEVFEQILAFENAGTRTWVLPFFSAADLKVGYDDFAGAPVDGAGVETGDVGDGIHPVNLGVTHAAWARQARNFILSRLA